MPRTVPAGLTTHLAEDATTLAIGWKIIRRDGVIRRINNTSKTIVADFAFPSPFADGTQTYTGGIMGRRTNLDASADMEVDNLTVAASFDSVLFDEADLRRGLYNGAEVLIFTYNHRNTAQGAIRMFRGKFGDAKANPRGFFSIELRSVMEIYRRNIGEIYSQDCRADVGDARCRVPIDPPVQARSTAYSSTIGDYIKAAQTELSILNSGAESGTSQWTNEIGTLTYASVATPHSGSAYFKGGVAELETKAYQDITIPAGLLTDVDAGDATLNLSYWQLSADEASDDTAQMTIRFYDGTATIIGGETSIALSANVTAWTKKGTSLAIPATARTVRVAMRFVGNTGPDTDSYIDTIKASISVPVTTYSDYGTVIWRATNSGTTGTYEPTFDTAIGSLTYDGSVIWQAEYAWSREATVVAVDSTNNRRKFTITELTPSIGGSVIGRDYFPDDAMNGGVVWWQTGDNAENGMEIRDFVSDDGIIIEQEVELFRDMPRTIQVGDVLRIHRGCDHTKATCVNIFSNALNAIAEWWVPGRDATRDYPDAH